MAKMFYTTEEAAKKLGKSEAQLKDMVAKGQLQEFRDRDRLMFKVEQVDLLSGGDDFIPLAESGEHDIGLASSGTNIPAKEASGAGKPGKDAKEGTGIALFDAEATDEADANAVTRVTSSPLKSFKDPGSSGSGSRAGLMDMTKEADDTSLGAGLLEDVYGTETMAQQTAAEAPAAGGGDAGALFETTGVSEGTEVAGGVGVAAMVAAEPYDGPGSGWVGGLALGTALVTGVAAFTAIVGIAGGAGSGMLSNMVKTLGDNVYAAAGGGAVLCGLLALAGWLFARKS